MEKFSYSFFARIIYRYGNVIATPLLSVHLVASVIILFEKWYFIFPALINFIIILLINKYFIKTYRIFPFKIEADNEKMICSDFFLSKKVIVVKFEDIEEISGGMFSTYQTRPIYLYDSKQKIKIGFYSHVGKFQKLLTKILQNVPEKLYNEIMDRIKNSRMNKK